MAFICYFGTRLVLKPYAIEEWRIQVGDVPSVIAILDRFLHHAYIIAMKGKSYRLKDRACKSAAKG